MLNIWTHPVPILRSVEPRPEPGIRIGIDCVDRAAVFQADLRRSLVAPDGPAVEEKKERRRVDAFPCHKVRVPATAATRRPVATSIRIAAMATTREAPFFYAGTRSSKTSSSSACGPILNDLRRGRGIGLAGGRGFRRRREGVAFPR